MITNSLKEQSHPCTENLNAVPREVPLSFAQERLWVLDQLHSLKAAYNMPLVYRLKGDLRLEALKLALARIVDRHETLRTRFVMTDGQTRGFLMPPEPVPVPVAKAEDEKALTNLVQQEVTGAFDLSKDQLLRAKLIEVSPSENVLVLTIHHIAADEWSLEIICEELGRLYDGFVSGSEVVLPSLPMTYAEYARQQKEQLEGEALDDLVDYWTLQLKDAPEVLELPTDYPRKANSIRRGGIERLLLDKSLYTGLRQSGKEHRCSPFMSCLAAYMALLHRYTEQKDLLVGIPVGWRLQAETQGLVGLFVNSAAIRSVVNEESNFDDLLRQTRDTVFGALSHHNLPFEQVVKAVGADRSSASTPLIQTMFMLEELGEPPSFGGLKADNFLTHTGTTKFDLLLLLKEQPDGVLASLEYDADLFAPETVRRMLVHFEHLVKTLIASPQQPLFSFSLLTPAEQQHMLVEWNQTGREFPPLCLHELFEQQVRLTPHAEAVVWRRQRLSYCDLNRRADELAHHLRSMGVGPETLVAVCVPRCPELVVAILAVLKAGAAYVPLDPNYPLERIQFILEDAHAPVLLTYNAARQKLPRTDAKIICVDSFAGNQNRAEDPEDDSAAAPGNLAYVIYTSGSTGSPKGVAIEHHSAVSLINWAQSVFHKPECAGVLFSTSICFDLSVFEIFLPLSCGGKIILSENVLELPALPAKNEVTLVNTVPSVMKELVEQHTLPNSVQCVNLAGEPLAPELVNKLYALPHIDKVYDLYGPSETTTYSTAALRQKNGEPTIGRPIANTRIYLLDGHEQPVPIGVPGQIYIGGEGVARGYLNRPKLTEERFVETPCGEGVQGRLYRTGDLARYLPNSNIQFLGRMDNQVKIHGFRIEPGEIEATLKKHAAVREAVVVTYGESSGEKLLAACVVLDRSQPTTEEQLASWLSQKLPHFMVPARFRILEKLPLMPNGKVDRRALCGLQQPKHLREHAEPKSAVEKALALMFKDLLGVERVGANDNFFQLGGHSLLVTRLVSRVREKFGVELPLRSVFENPTVRELSVQLEQALIEDIKRSAAA